MIGRRGVWEWGRKACYNEEVGSFDHGVEYVLGRGLVGLGMCIVDRRNACVLGCG